ncbi:MAG: PadR family transcriptional regulator [Desulfurococcales archaeon]|nr:PadR family transcriptional regulator [Desulfurococcales archaeon]MEB3789512.1 PadR family transcriptional regulator [Desulfurococcales archaeon]
MRPRSRNGSSLYRESLRNLVLRILAEGPTHGYHIMRRVEEITDGKWRPAAGTLYPLLEQMQEEGYIEIREVSTGRVRGGKRIVYSLTDKGWKKLAEILLEKSEAKMKMLYYLIVEGAVLLRNKGYSEEADQICNILNTSTNQFMEELEKSCR